MGEASRRELRNAWRRLVKARADRERCEDHHARVGHDVDLSGQVGIHAQVEALLVWLNVVEPIAKYKVPNEELYWQTYSCAEHYAYDLDDPSVEDWALVVDVARDLTDALRADVTGRLATASAAEDEAQTRYDLVREFVGV